MRLQPKVVLLLMPLIVVPLAVVGWIGYNQLYNSYQQKSMAQIAMLQEQIDLHMHKAMENARANIRLFSESDILIRYVLTRNEDERYGLMQRPLQREVISYQKAYPDYYEFRIILPDGYEDFRQVSMEINNISEYESGSDIFKELHGATKNIVSVVTKNYDNDEVALYMGMPIYLIDKSIQSVSSKPELKSYLVLTISLDFLLEQINKNEIGSSGGSFVTDKTGKMLFYSDDMLRNQSIETEQYRIADNGNSKPYLKIPKDVFASIEKVVAAGTVYEGKLFGQRSLIRGKKIHENMYLFSWLPENDLLYESQNLRNVVTIITLVAIVLGSILAYIALRLLILNPLNKLDMAALSIGEGKLVTDIDVKSHDEMGSLAATFCAMSEKLKSSTDHARYISYHDNLTGLPNRLMFREYLGHYIANARRKNESLALLFLDVDNFKWVNDTLGHDVGDNLLREFSERLQTMLRTGDIIAQDSIKIESELIARVGGDEFIILLPNINGALAAGIVARRILACMQPSFVLDGHEMHAGVSIGATLYPDDGLDPDVLIKNADIAMYHAKKQGKNNYQYYSDSMNELAQQRLKMETRLRKAIEEEQFTLHYQPQVDIVNENIIGMEALIRWLDPVDGYIPPDRFIPVAEETGLILQIGEWVMDKVCKQIHSWKSQGYADIRVAINVSSIQFQRQDLAGMLKKYINKYDLQTGEIEVELTESIYICDEEKVQGTLSAIRKVGVKIALDDFGTGYSSLAYLRRYPIDILKIDRSFINEINQSDDGETVINAIIRMAHAMNLLVIAEGVEDKAQLDFLRKKKCDYIQGYYYYRPMPADEISAILLNKKIRRANNQV
ncbi:MAG: EAL domain-containing protein [Gammaproteobacteria bacterium]|nr:EAL domain-containing protein [Gammaproteobacteria bacterium]